MTSFVYLLVESDKFKIGKANNPSQRAKMVVSDVIAGLSWAIEFESSREALACEKSLHFMYRKYRLPKIKQDGGTEFFKLEALNEVINFIEVNNNLFNYKNLKSGLDFINQEPVKNKLTVKKEKRIKPEIPTLETTYKPSPLEIEVLKFCGEKIKKAKNINSSIHIRIFPNKTYKASFEDAKKAADNIFNLQVICNEDKYTHQRLISGMDSTENRHISIYFVRQSLPNLFNYLDAINL